jgi:hypothetical protein
MLGRVALIASCLALPLPVPAASNQAGGPLAIWDYYQTGRFDERWWQLTRANLADMLAQGSDVVYVPIFFNRRETFRRPCQNAC